jgi:hypothetical protein
MLPEALSDALGISLSEVLEHYYSVSDLAERSRLKGEAMDRRRTAEEGEEWLKAESRRMDVDTTPAASPRVSEGPQKHAIAFRSKHVYFKHKPSISKYRRHIEDIDSKI